MASPSTTSNNVLRLEIARDLGRLQAFFFSLRIRSSTTTPTRKTLLCSAPNGAQSNSILEGQHHSYQAVRDAYDFLCAGPANCGESLGGRPSESH